MLRITETNPYSDSSPANRNEIEIDCALNPHLINCKGPAFLKGEEPEWETIVYNTPNNKNCCSKTNDSKSLMLESNRADPRVRNVHRGKHNIMMSSKQRTLITQKIKKRKHSFDGFESEEMYEIQPVQKAESSSEITYGSSSIRRFHRKSTLMMHLKKYQHVRRKSCCCKLCGEHTNLERKVVTLPSYIPQHWHSFNNSLLKIHTRCPSTPPKNKENQTVFQKFQSFRVLTPILTKKNYLEILHREVRRQSAQINLLKGKSPLLSSEMRESRGNLLSPALPEKTLCKQDRRLSFNDEILQRNNLPKFENEGRPEKKDLKLEIPTQNFFAKSLSQASGSCFTNNSAQNLSGNSTPLSAYNPKSELNQLNIFRRHLFMPYKITTPLKENDKLVPFRRKGSVASATELTSSDLGATETEKILEGSSLGPCFKSHSQKRVETQQNKEDNTFERSQKKKKSLFFEFNKQENSETKEKMIKKTQSMSSNLSSKISYKSKGDSTSTHLLYNLATKNVGKTPYSQNLIGDSLKLPKINGSLFYTPRSKNSKSQILKY